MGVQLSAVSLLGDSLISAGGATRYPKNIVSRYPDVFGGAQQGYTNYTFALNVAQAGAEWMRIPDMPGPRRETDMAVTVDGAMYVFGGFSHSEPYTFRDGYRLCRKGEKWIWETLPVELPWPVSVAGIAAVGHRIYLLGGADFYPEGGSKPDFFSDRSRTGDPVGTSLLVLDTTNLAAGWRRLAPLPGTSRFDQAFATVGNRLYSLAGINRGRDVEPMQYRSVTDAWMYDLDMAKWSRLPDTPASANASAVAWRDYVIVMGGFRYAEKLGLNGSRIELYSAEEKKMAAAKDFHAFVQRDVFVFDTRHNHWGSADALLERASLPMAAVAGNRIFAMGGEGGRLWHSDTLQIGSVEEHSPDH